MTVDINTTEKPVHFTDVLLELGVNRKHVKYLTERVKLTNEPYDKASMDMGLISPEIIALAISKIAKRRYLKPNEVDKINVHALKMFLKLRNPDFKIDSFEGYIPAYVENNKLFIAVSSVNQMNLANNSYYDYQKEYVIASSQTIQKLYRFAFSNAKEDFFDSIDKLRKMDDEIDAQDVLEGLYCNLLKLGCYTGVSDIKIWRSSAAGMISFKKEGRGELLCTLSIPEYEAITGLLKTKSSNSDKIKFEPKETKIDKLWFSNVAFHKMYADIFDRYVFRVQIYIAPDTEWLSTVIRINDSQSQVTDFSSLDFDDESKKLLRRWINSPTGLFLVTGPTGSGKTSVLYSMLREIDPVDRGVFTVENPIEYKNGMWIQKLMEKSKDRSEGEMARLMLNSLLREAPDVILFGEVRRDKETLDIVMDASNTGHLVLSTMHTKSAPDTILRLLDIGADSKSIASTLMGILAVRLIGLLCTCKKEDTTSSTEKLFEHYSVKPEKIYRAVGCPLCNDTGYRGRKMVYEILDCGKVRGHIESGAKSLKDITNKGLLNNKSMWDRGIAMIANGETSIEEVEKRIFNPELEV